MIMTNFLTFSLGISVTANIKTTQGVINDMNDGITRKILMPQVHLVSVESSFFHSSPFEEQGKERVANPFRCMQFSSMCSSTFNGG